MGLLILLSLGFGLVIASAALLLLLELTVRRSLNTLFLLGPAEAVRLVGRESLFLAL